VIASLSLIGVLLIGIGGYFILTLSESDHFVVACIVGGLLILVGIGIFAGGFLWPVFYMD
jgi:hypothetical protein